MSKQLIEIQNLAKEYPDDFSKYNGQWAVIVRKPDNSHGQYMVETIEGKILCLFKNQMKMVV